MKKILLALGLVAVIVSCKEENKVEVPAAPEAPKVDVKVPEVKVEVPKVEIK